MQQLQPDNQTADPVEVSTPRSDLLAAESRRLGSWFAILALFVSFLILVGGTVRLTDSGLSIPEWPLIQGSLLPPLSEAGWQRVYDRYYLDIHDIDVAMLGSEERSQLISLRAFQTIFAIEYFHRFVAAFVGLLFLVLFTQVMRSSPLRSQYGRRLSLTLFLLLSQAVLGGIVVRLDLRAEFVAFHLGIAFILFGLWTWTAAELLWGKRSQWAPHWLAKSSWIALAAIFIQIVSGGMVAGTKAGHFLNSWPKMGEHWIPPLSTLFSDYAGHLLLNQYLLQFLHRWWAFVALAAIMATVVLAMRQALQPRARYLLRAVISVVVLQVLLGITTLVLHVPIALGIAHLGVGTLLFAIVVLLNYELSGYETTTA